jgi:hypothetical protein
MDNKELIRVMKSAVSKLKKAKLPKKTAYTILTDEELAVAKNLLAMPLNDTWASRRTCGTKRRYTREKATGIGRAHNGFRLYPYQCPVCFGWHLTRRIQSNGRVSFAELEAGGRI